VKLLLGQFIYIQYRGYLRILINNEVVPHISRTYFLEPCTVNETYFYYLIKEYMYDQCCGSGMFIPDPGSDPIIFWYPGSRSDRLLSRIPDPDPTNKRREK
jgi:hypothetical protein